VKVVKVSNVCNNVYYMRYPVAIVMYYTYLTTGTSNIVGKGKA